MTRVALYGMTGDRWRELRNVRPVNRVRKPMPPSARRRERGDPRDRHTRVGPARAGIGIARTRRHRSGPDGTWRWTYDPSPDRVTWHTTKPMPWALRARNRARRKAARATRKTQRR